ncbi:MAG: polysaccharide deacetylase family protein [Chloroflexota bacterium]|nr:polysaccharide deacetylase family protein [Chloroflexota bacterium]
MTRRSLAAAIAVLVLLSACSGTPSPSGSAQPTPTATPFGTILPGESASAVPTGQASPIAATYTVLPGDSLWSISRAWGTTVAQLQAWNGGAYPSLLTDPNTVEAGWILVVAEDPDRTPQPTATAPASGCRAGNRVPAGEQETLATVPNADHGVALTLDMGGRLDPGIDILNFLIAQGVCATIFPTGAMTQTPEGQRIMAIIGAHPELFEIGNHTMHHCNLVAGGGGSPTTAPCAGVEPTADFIRSELTDAATILQQFSGQEPTPYWRPPFGVTNQAVRDAAASVGYTKTIMWDVDTIDWKPIADGGPTAEQIATKVVSRAVDGSIVLMHLGGYETLDALEIMVPALRERGFLLTTVSDQLN